MPDYINGFKNIASYSDVTFSDNLEASIYSWLRYSFINIGAFWNIDRTPFPSSGTDYQLPYGNSYAARLKNFADPRYDAGCYWAGFRSQWLWESTVTNGIQPKGPVLSVYVDGVEMEIADGGFYVDYNEGAIIFTTAVDTDSEVTCDVSFMGVQIRRSDEPFFQQIQERSMRKDETFDLMTVLDPYRVQLPCIITDPTNIVSTRPFEIGNRSRTQSQDFMFHILAETPWERRRIHDILVEQYDTRIDTYDLGQIIANQTLWNAWNTYWSSSFTQWNTTHTPISYQYGSPTPILDDDPATYPALCVAAPWSRLRVKNIVSNNQEQLGKRLFASTVNYRLEFDI